MHSKSPHDNFQAHNRIENEHFPTKSPNRTKTNRRMVAFAIVAASQGRRGGRELSAEEGRKAEGEGLRVRTAGDCTRWRRAERVRGRTRAAGALALPPRRPRRPACPPSRGPACASPSRRSRRNTSWRSRTTPTCAA